jgi:tyrosyl-DNA phosphodiesterase-1
MSSSPREHKRRKVDTSSSRLRSLSSAVSPPAHETTEPVTFGDASSSRLRSLSAVSPPAHETTEPVTFGDAADPLKDLFRGAREDSSAPEKVKDLTAEQKVIDLTADVTDAKDINGGKSQSESKLNTEMQKLTSPFRLTKIRDLPASENRDTVGIDDILGDVMLREVWLFNYMHEIPWVMEKLDEDIKQHVKVWFVHGNWKQDDASRKFMEATAKDYPNVKLIAAYMPEAFGTHHTKIMVLFRADDTAQ